MVGRSSRTYTDGRVMITELTNPLTQEYLELKRSVCSNRFPWYYSETSVSAQGNNFLLFSHPVVLRPVEGKKSKVVSKRFEKAMPVITQIFEANELRPEHIYRMCFNIAMHNAHKMSDPHVDHEFPHKNLLIYLNDVSCGPTYVFKETFSAEYPAGSYDAYTHDLVIEHECEPVEDKVVSFDGFHYHAQGFPKIGERRITLVVTYG